MWDDQRGSGKRDDEQRQPVFILVCKNKIAKVLYEWIAEEKPPPAFPRPIAALRNANGSNEHHPR